MWLKRTRDSGLREEMQQHIEERVGELVARGMAREAAFDAARLTMKFSLPQVRYAKPAQRAAFFRTVMERVRGLPGVESAGLVSTIPAGGYARVCF